MGAAFWPLEPMEVVTLWLSVDRSTTENGCLRVVPGSHRGDVAAVRAVPTSTTCSGPRSPSTSTSPPRWISSSSRGDVKVHHPNIVHGSRANTSPHRRCGLTIRYIPTSTRITGPEQPFASALLLRGEPGVNAYQPRPTYRPGDDVPFRDAGR